jgi:predicted amidohydrolase
MSPDRQVTTVACCQVSLQVGALEANREACLSAAERAVLDGANVIVLPELAASGYVFDSPEEARALAEPVSGPTVSRWTDLASRTGITIVGGICELGEDGNLYNTAVVVAGLQVRAVYRKAHLWDREKLVFTPGSQAPPVVDVGEARLAVMICYDLGFPEWVRHPALAGAQLLCVPTNWPRFPRPDGERPMEVVRAQAAAAVNRMYVAACDRVGPERGVDWVGGSVIIDPDGWPLTGPADDGAAIIMAACHLETATDKTISEHNDVLGDRRPALYRRLFEESPKAHEGGNR